MFKSLKISILTALTLCAFTFSSNVIAKECYEQSPNLASSADHYYNLDDTVELSHQERNQLKNFFRGIKGQWKGQLAYIECRGPDHTPRTITKKAIVTAKATLVSSEKVLINAQKNYTKERVKKQENFSLFNPKHTYALEFSNSNTLIFSEKYRRTNNFVVGSQTTKNKKPIAQTKQAKQAKKYKSANEVNTNNQTTKIKTSRITEVIYEVTSHTNALTLLRSFYINGVYTGEEKWSMQAN